MLAEQDENKGFLVPSPAALSPPQWLSWRPNTEEGHHGVSLPQGSGGCVVTELTALLETCRRLGSLHHFPRFSFHR